jgi:proteasome beta subunit
MTATAAGTHRLSDEEITTVAERVVAGRHENPGG